MPQNLPALLFTLPFLFSFIKPVHAQETLGEVLQKYDTYKIPYISVEMLRMNQEDYIILDTRKKEEYQVSHIASAIWVGEHFDAQRINSLKLLKSQPLVVYCTVGVRSAQYGNQMKNRGFTQINNLYGSIFAWKNAGFTVVDRDERETENVHIYSKIWGKYLKNGQKVY